MDAVDGIIGMMPVDERIVKTHFKAFFPESVYPHAQDVLSIRRVGGLVIREFGIEQAKALVVFRGDHCILHAGGFGHLRPGMRVEKVGIEIVEVLLIFFIGEPFVVFHPFVTGGQGIKPPMYEHAKPVVSPPGQTFVFMGFGFVPYLFLAVTQHRK